MVNPDPLPISGEGSCGDYEAFVSVQQSAASGGRTGFWDRFSSRVTPLNGGGPRRALQNHSDASFASRAPGRRLGNRVKGRTEYNISKICCKSKLTRCHVSAKALRKKIAAPESARPDSIFLTPTAPFTTRLWITRTLSSR